MSITPPEKWNQKTAKLFSAARNGQTNILRKFQNEEPALLKTVDPVGNSVAHWAVKGGQVKILRFLWANYPEVLWTVNVNGQQPVHTGCIAGKFLCVALLIDISSALEEPDANGCTPLLLASKHGRAEIAAYLLLLSANINATDDEGNTALHLAARAGHTNLCSLLLFFGANPFTTCNNRQQTPLHLACEAGRFTVVRQFSRAVPNRNAIIDKRMASKAIEEEFAHALQQRDHEGQSPFQAAKKNGWSEISEFLGMKMSLYYLRRRSLWDAGHIRLTLKTFILGEPGRRRLGVICIVVAIMCFIYPFYWIQIWTDPYSWDERQTLKLLWILLHIPSWYCYFKATYSDPGFIPTETNDYQTVLRMSCYTRLRASPEPAAERGDKDRLLDTEELARIKRSLASLCHTCQCVKPLRSKHCAVCDRCVKLFDHHCPLTDQCVGAKNHIWFFGLCAFTSALSTMFAYLLWTQSRSLEISWGWSAVFKIVLFAIWLCSTGTFINVIHAATRNLTTNETLNWERYSYLHRKANGSFRNPFDRGPIINVLEYFGFRSPMDPNCLDSVPSSPQSMEV
ncbi:hypothetical protein CSKR_106048 [Clonorchis sinensis]|uniref:Palmitoyltransferase n=1 Tax=Clonorchis sinensis TaxID=79923 RepID=A0A8T1MAT7_CLOSI|nr:hypothetical protein CSKR_106048 [Clonorchis sinensis]